MNTIFSFIVIISILIFVHELGHFLAAKISGMKVEEFSIGFKPSIFSKKIGETKYTLGMIPMGGYVKIFGENLEMEKDNALNIKDEKKREERLIEIEKNKKRAFSSKSKIAQILVLSMGVIFNFIFAYLVFFMMIFSGTNVSTADVSSEDKIYINDMRLMVGGVIDKSQAQKSGLESNVEIIKLEIDGVKQNLYSDDFMNKISLAREKIDIEYYAKGVLSKEKKESFLRGDEMIELKKVSIPVTFNSKGGKEKFGIYFSQEGKLKLPFLKNFKYSWKVFSGFMVMTVDGFKKLFVGEVGIDEMSGPVGIAKISGQAAEQGFDSVLILLAILSINLGIINILPFPALDGGRIALLLIEVFSRRRIPVNIVNYINAIGFIILIIFIMFVTYKDIIKF